MVFHGAMRELLSGTTDLSDAELIDLYATDDRRGRPFVRFNMAASVDGSATGSDGRSGSINTEADHVIFDLLRGWADVIVAGSGTVAAERYDAPVTGRRWQSMRSGRPADPALAILTSKGRVPDTVDTSGGGEVFAVESDPETSFGTVVERLAQRGYRRILCEGGPTIAGHALSGGAVDELCLTWSPKVVVGNGPRIAHGAVTDRPLDLLSLLEQDGTLIGRWGVR